MNVNFSALEPFGPAEYSFGAQRGAFTPARLGSVDPATLERLNKQFADSGYPMRAPLSSVVIDKTFAMVTEQPVPDARTASAIALLAPAGGH